MLILLRDSFVEARVDVEDPNVVFIYARQKGDIERFTPLPSVRVSTNSDYKYSARISREKFLQALEMAANNNSYLSLVESVAERDARRREHYRALIRLMASDYGAFGMAGFLADKNPGYPPDIGLPDDADVAEFLQDE